MSEIHPTSEAATATALEEVCLVSLFDGVSSRICALPAMAMVRLGCVHEHVQDVPVCGQHAAEAEARLGVCHPCYFAVENPHTCPLLGRRLP